MSHTPRRRRGRGGRNGHEPRARIRTRELRAMELSVLGSPQDQIAEDLGITQAAVSKILKRVELRVLAELTVIVHRQKARHTLRLEHLYAEMMRAWEQSKADHTRRRQRKTQSEPESAGATVVELVVENQHGDPRYVDEARKVLADLRKLWGLDAPQKVDVSGPRSPYVGMNEEELRDQLAQQTRLLQGLESISTATQEPSPIDASATTSQEPADVDPD